MNYKINEFKDYLESNYNSYILNTVELNCEEQSSYIKVIEFIECHPLKHDAILFKEKKIVKIDNYNLICSREEIESKKVIDFFLRNTNEKLNYNYNIEDDSGTISLYLTNADNLPIIPRQWKNVRATSFFSKHEKNTFDLIKKNKKIARAINSFLFFDIFSDWIALLGSSHIILRNPLYKCINVKYSLEENGKKAFVCMAFTPYINKNDELSTLEIISREKHILGSEDEQVTKTNIKENSVVKISYTDICNSQFSYSILSSSHGMIDQSNYHGFIKDIKLNIGINTDDIVNHVVDNHGNTLETIKNKKFTYETININKQNNEYSFCKVLRKGLISRNKIAKAEELGQYIFYNDKDVNNRIISIFENAKKSIIFIDPFFDIYALLRFANANKNESASIEIFLCEKKLMEKAGGKYKMNEKNSDLFAKYLKNIHRKMNLKVNIMKGNGAFHDRFIIVDNEVWLSGTSLKDIGDRVSTIIKLPNGDEVMTILSNLRTSGEVFDFYSWHTDKKTKKGSNRGTGK